MRVLIVNKFLHPNGGSETYIFKIGEQLKKTGHEVQYFGMEHPKRIVGNRVESYTSNMDFHTGKLQKLLYPFRIIYSVEARRKIRLVLDDFQPDVVHLNNFNFQLTPSILYEIRSFEKKDGKRVKIVFTAHDYQLVCPNHLLQVPATGEMCTRCLEGHVSNCTRYRCIHNSGVKSLLGTVEGWLYQRLHAYRKIDTVICPSRFMEEKLSVSPDLAGKTKVLYNFVDRVESEKWEKKPYVLYFGRYCKEKGTQTLLEVCRKLPEIPFVFAGGGPMEEDVNGLPNVENRGFLSGEELRRVIGEAVLTVFPSEWYENCPFAVMESQIYGTPVIGADIGGVPELMEDGKTGELFQSGDVQVLTEKISRLWNERELVKKYTENCRNCKFDTVEEYCMKLMDLYKRE